MAGILQFLSRGTDVFAFNDPHECGVTVVVGHYVQFHLAKNGTHCNGEIAFCSPARSAGFVACVRVIVVSWQSGQTDIVYKRQQTVGSVKYRICSFIPLSTTSSGKITRAISLTKLGLSYSSWTMRLVEVTFFWLGSISFSLWAPKMTVVDPVALD